MNKAFRQSGTDPVFTVSAAVADHVLEATRQAYLSRDFERYAERFLLPQTLGTVTGTRRIENRTDLHDMFAAMCTYFDREGIVDLSRHTVAARFASPDEVHTTFLSHHVRRDGSRGPTIGATSVLKRCEALWRIAESRYVTQDAQVTSALSQGGSSNIGRHP